MKRTVTMVAIEDETIGFLDVTLIADPVLPGDASQLSIMGNLGTFFIGAFRGSEDVEVFINGELRNLRSGEDMASIRLVGTRKVVA